jgi:hypothetical protein
MPRPLRFQSPGTYHVFAQSVSCRPLLASAQEHTPIFLRADELLGVLDRDRARARRRLESFVTDGILAADATS